jgi:hypothetical protein
LVIYPAPLIGNWPGTADPFMRPTTRCPTREVGLRPRFADPSAL